MYLKLDNSISVARFLTEEDRIKGVERLRSNNTGIVSSTFRWSHVWELCYDPKTIPFVGMALLVNVGA